MRGLLHTTLTLGMCLSFLDLVGTCISAPDIYPTWHSLAASAGILTMVCAIVVGLLLLALERAKGPRLPRISGVPAKFFHAVPALLLA